MTKEIKIEWSDSYLFDWEKKVVGGRHNNFEDYMFSIGVISGRGGINKPNEYLELIRKWNSLSYARERLEKKEGYVARKKWLKIIKSRFSKFTDKMNMKKVLDPTLPLVTKQDLKEAGEVKPTYTLEEEAQNKIDVAKIPF